MQDDETLKPWYKHLWVWLIMLPPAASVIGGIVTLILAGGPPQMVNDNANPGPAIVQPEIDGAGGVEND